MARSDPRLAVELALPIGFTALLAATAVIVAAQGVLSAGDALGLLVAVVAVVCWVGRPLAAVPVAVLAWMFFLTFAERPVDDLRVHGPADWGRLAVLAAAAAGAAATRARRLYRYRVPPEEDLAAAASELGAG